ncbi:sugar kinase [Pseudoalteromonas tunicata]|uniref:sugar kinase n=1 Tax=Pseudoalteromonas tunicata TaxID=314281 RepID=UPI00273E9146|nr:sugar kinase [Pseudoalteromonas tunicata]MDP5215248.1 sugar kinase [Pseudoalteromonas tunicata]
MIKIAFFGEAMHELSPNHAVSFGGDTYNSAVYLKRLLDRQADVYFVSAIGCDELSIHAHTLWLHQGLNLQYLQHSPARTLGVYGITTDEQGERAFHYNRKNSAARVYFDLDQQQMFLIALKQKQFDYVYFSAISLAILDEAALQLFIAHVEAYKQAGGRVIFDSNYREILWQNKAQAQKCYQQAFKIADIIFATNDDHFGVFGQCSEYQLSAFYQACSHALVVIKQGIDDTLVLQTVGQNHTLSRYPVSPVTQVVDTTAAGDSFSAGFLAEYLSGQPIKVAINTAQRLAAQVIGGSGAIVATSIMPMSSAVLHAKGLFE